MMLIAVTLAATALAGAPLAAQGMPDLSEDLTSASSIASAAKSMTGAAGDSLLVRDLLGSELKGADGEVVGTVENLAVIPGGRVIAAIVSTGENTRIAVPFAAVKLADSASGLQASVPASELTGMSELESLAQSLTE